MATILLLFLLFPLVAYQLFFCLYVALQLSKGSSANIILVSLLNIHISVWNYFIGTKRPGWQISFVSAAVKEDTECVESDGNSDGGNPESVSEKTDSDTLGEAENFADNGRRPTKLHHSMFIDAFHTQPKILSTYVQSKTPFLIFLHASWCKNCKPVTKFLQNEETLNVLPCDVVSIDLDELKMYTTDVSELKPLLKIEHVPTLLLISFDDKESELVIHHDVDNFSSGPTTQLVRMIEKYVHH